MRIADVRADSHVRAFFRVQACGVEAALNPLLQFVLRERWAFLRTHFAACWKCATNDDIDGFAGFFVRAKLLPACTKLISCSQRAVELARVVRNPGNSDEDTKIFTVCLPVISTIAQEYSPQGDLTAGPPARAARISHLKESVCPVHRLLSNCSMAWRRDSTFNRCFRFAPLEFCTCTSA